jgi:hypothetical protein
LTILDLFTRESLAIAVGQSLKGKDVAQCLNAVGRYEQRRSSCSATTDRSSSAGAWTSGHTTTGRNRLLPARETDRQGLCGVVQRDLTRRVSGLHGFATLTEARQIIELWRREYNESRPHRRPQGPTNNCAIAQVESFLIQNGVAKNPHLSNVQRTKQEEWAITGVIRGGKGKVSVAAKLFCADGHQKRGSGAWGLRRWLRLGSRRQYPCEG